MAGGRSLPLLAAAGVFAYAARLSDRSERPEYILFGAFVGSELVIVATIIIAQEPLLLPWLVLPVITLPARFSLARARRWRRRRLRAA